MLMAFDPQDPMRSKVSTLITLLKCKLGSEELWLRSQQLEVLGPEPK